MELLFRSREESRFHRMETASYELLVPMVLDPGSLRSQEGAQYLPKNNRNYLQSRMPKDNLRFKKWRPRPDSNR